jgi:hypothetical protein
MRLLQLPVPTAEALNDLETLYQKTHTVRECARAQIVLLALERHLKAAEIAAVMMKQFSVGPNGGWLKGSKDSRIGPC